MTPFIVLVGSFVMFRGLGGLGAAPLRSSVTSLRWALAVMFLLTASAHFGSRRPDLVQMVPPAFPAPELLVTLTGVAEVLGAAGLLVPRLAPWAAGGLVLLLLALFPANVHAARAGLSIGGAPVTPLVPRAVLQVVFVAATLAAGFPGVLSRRFRRAGFRGDGQRRGARGGARSGRWPGGNHDERAERRSGGERGAGAERQALVVADRRDHPRGLGGHRGGGRTRRRSCSAARRARRS